MSNPYPFAIISTTGKYSLGGYQTLKEATKAFESYKTSESIDRSEGLELVKYVPVVIDTISPSK